MPTVPERSIDNFTFLPCFNVKWGCQKQLRCVKDSSTIAADHNFPTLSSSSPNNRHRSFPDIGGIEAMREKLMFEIRSEAQALQMKAWSNSEDNVAGASKPWNLRNMRAVCKEPEVLTTSFDRKPNFAPAKTKSPKRSADDEGCVPRAKFSASLGKQEIEEDFLSILGTRPARRPKKRPRYVQKQIDGLFPGYWLAEITTDMYKVTENPEAGK